MKKLLSIIVIVVMGLTACKKETPITDTDTSATQARDALYSLMNDWYLWYKNMPVVNPTDYKDPYELMDAMKYKKIDRWSFVADYNDFMAQFVTGTFVGHGIRLGYNAASNKVYIVMIYKNSPLYTNGSGGPGVRRGWIVKKLNGQDIASLFASGNYTAYNNLMGASTVGITNTFVFTTPRGNDTTAVTTKQTFSVNTVLLADTVTLKSGLTGHLVYEQFTAPSEEELMAAFSFFQTSKVKDLILDLRYNLGGDEAPLAQLASYIAGSSRFSTPLMTRSFNDKKAASNNSTLNFPVVSYPLNLSRLVVITSRETASASEEVINGVRPFMPVTLIGDTTNGKPTGMNVWATNDQKYVFAPVTMEVVNSAGQGGFYTGFVPTKYVSDDISHNFNDKNESCFKEAIFFLEHGAVSTKGTYIYSPTKTYSEKPEWMNNGILISKNLTGK
jgi:carboxyl-terminal processing protease